MRKLQSLGLATFVMISLLASADAAVRTYQAVITHDQEPGGAVPEQGSGGVGTFVLNDNDPLNPFLTYDIDLFGLDIDGLQTPANANDNVTRTHFHSAAFGVNGGIVFGQIDPTASLRNDLDDLVVDPVAGTIKGVWDGVEGNGGTLASRLSAFLTLDANRRSLIYFNVHTADHAGGEVRGQLVFVPEPSTLLLIGLGAGLLAAMRKRR
jgi:hypothetical protein